jgi:hypothetical protein
MLHISVTTYKQLLIDSGSFVNQNSCIHCKWLHTHAGTHCNGCYPIRSLDYLSPLQLPKHFEAEVRNGPEAGHEILQLVSGRTLLGVVSLQPDVAQLPAPSAAGKQNLDHYLLQKCGHGPLSVSEVGMDHYLFQKCGHGPLHDMNHANSLGTFW